MQIDLTMETSDLGRFTKPTVKLNNLVPFVRAIPQRAPTLIILKRAIFASRFRRTPVLAFLKPSVTGLPAHPSLNENMAIVDETAAAWLDPLDFVSRDANPTFDRVGSYIGARSNAKSLADHSPNRPDLPISGALALLHAPSGDMNRQARFLIAGDQRRFKGAWHLRDVNGKGKNSRRRQPCEMFIDGSRFVARVGKDRAIRGRDFAPCGHKSDCGRLDAGPEAQHPQFRICQRARHAVVLKLNHALFPVSAAGACVASRALSWVSDDRPAPRQRRRFFAGRMTSRSNTSTSSSLADLAQVLVVSCCVAWFSCFPPTDLAGDRGEAP
jgi:hypothetical protein